ncbi:MAG: SDR family NAD(P)-dependent oxidoreductase [Ahrensia sp.]|nr:SDR family NAD(P)-dependent oxidoreductase [Ahrensia sp.]
MRALVTGASHGLGRALTQSLLDDGHEVVAVDIDTAPLDALIAESRGACKARLADLASESSVQRLLDVLTDQTFDLVILNAGISATGRFEDIPQSAYERLIAVNLTAPITLASQLVGQNAMAARSTIVFVSSLSHAVGYPGAAVYAATKSGLALYAKGVRRPFAKRGVRVLTVFPGPIRTDHAERHAPPGAKANRRMAPDKLAGLILKAVRRRKRELYPGMGAAMAKLFGNLAPNAATRAMRKAIFDKLDGPVW